jgi:hypothetical protein
LSDDGRIARITPRAQGLSAVRFEGVELGLEFLARRAAPGVADPDVGGVSRPAPDVHPQRRHSSS